MDYRERFIKSMGSIEEIEQRKEKILRLKMDLRFEYKLQEKALAMGKLYLPENDLIIQDLLYWDEDIKEYEENFSKNFSCHNKI
jgi:hypothetical protein